VVVFTDGMANEGVTDSAALVSEIRRRVDALRADCHFAADYAVNIATLGTGGFLPQLVYDVGRAFSSDPFYFLDDRSDDSGAARGWERGKLPPYGWTSRNYVICVCFDTVGWAAGRASGL